MIRQPLTRVPSDLHRNALGQHALYVLEVGVGRAARQSVQLQHAEHGPRLVLHKVLAENVDRLEQGLAQKVPWRVVHFADLDVQIASGHLEKGRVRVHHSHVMRAQLQLDPGVEPVG